MSYILDALKKSEHERQQHQSPTVHSIHSPARLSQDSSRLPWVLVVSAVLVLSLCSFGFWWHATDQKPSFSDMLSVALPPKENTVQAVVKKNDVVKPVLVPKTTPIQTSKTVSQAQPEYAKINAAPNSNVGEPLPIIPVLDLADDLHNSLPAMTYSFHVYSTDKNKRTIIINNHRYREGEMVGANWLLESITETGIVLRKGRDRTSIDVVDGWK